MTTSGILYGITNNLNEHLTNFFAAVRKIDSSMHAKRTSKINRISIHSYGIQVSMSVKYHDGMTKIFTIPDGHALFKEHGYDALHSKVFQMLYDEDVVNYW